MKKTITAIISNFVENLNDLRELLKLPEKYEKQAKSAKREIDRIILPVLINKVESDLVKPPKGIKQESIRLTFNKLIAEYKKLDPKNVSQDGKLKIKIDKEYLKSIPKKQLERAGDTFSHCVSYKIHIEKAVLFNLISYLEQSFSDVAHIILNSHSEILCIGEKNLTFDEIKKFSTFDDAKEYLISEEIEKLLFKPLLAFFDFFEEKVFKIKFPNLSEFKNEIIEIKERRNLIIHNGGIVNSRYINAVEKSLQEKYKTKKDTKIKLDKEYLIECIEKIELIGLEILSLVALKFQEDEDRNKSIWEINDIIYNTFAKRDKNYLLGEKLSLFMLGDKCKKYLTDEQKDYIQLNYWYILKKQNKIDVFKNESSKYDISAKNNIIKLCYYSLTGNYTKACEYIVPSLNDEKFDLRYYKEFPILDELRKQKKAMKELQKFKVKIE